VSAVIVMVTLGDGATESVKAQISSLGSNLLHVRPGSRMGPGRDSAGAPSFKLEDAMKVDVSAATVVTLYLLTSSNEALRPSLTKQLKPGARIVSHAFGMGDWQAQKTERIADESGFNRTIYLWVADGKFRP